MRVALLCAGLVAASPLWWRPIAGAPEEKPRPFTGKVVRLQPLLEKSGVKIDRDSAPFLVGLVADGKIYPILKDDSGRRFFKDEALLNREYRINGRLIGGTMLQVLSAQSIKDGKPHDIYYWCDICAIRRSEKMECECCGAPMELREELIRK